MCGIFFCKVLDEAGCGPANLDELFSSALEKMRYRGQDNVAIRKINGLHFGHSRLAINGLNPESNQPVVTDDYALIFNGEYYNYKEDYAHKGSDTLALFDHLLENPDAHSFVNGPYAYAWYDIKNDKVVFRRDVFGEKPLYYYKDETVVLVSSTLKSILFFVKGIGGRVLLNIDALRCDYVLNGFIREPETVWKGIYEIPPNHSLFLNGVDILLKKESFFCSADSRSSVAEKYLKYSLITRDVDAALLLSSGVDSSYLLVKSIESGAGLSLVTYGGCDGSGEVSEVENNLSFIDLNEAGCKFSALQKVGEGRPDCISEEIAFYAGIMEQPTSDGLQVHRILQHLKSEFPHLKVVYSGLGGDEIFGGYPSFNNYQLINILASIPKSFLLVPKMRRFLEGREMLGEWGVMAYYFLYRADSCFVKKEHEDTLRESYRRFKEGIYESVPSGLFERYKDCSSMQLKLLETFDYCKNQLLRDMDNISMHHGVEARAPLLNPHLIMQAVDNKKGLKEYVQARTKISFGKKKGFSILDHDCLEKYKKSLSRNREVLNAVFGEKVCNVNYLLDIGAMRKFSFIAEWLKVNVAVCEVDGETLVAR
ncbi:asparagine synthetase B family protein [Halomonas sp. YLGW01]|uniref:asparagine synthase-related protein n=1 Tax=Halomonas sp. YLGW01 TaxID=2773308 RepID=UPI001782C708|nr:asparagine synthetase B family protein [Halomonas sp. YLGW01]